MRLTIFLFDWCSIVLANNAVHSTNGLLNLSLFRLKTGLLVHRKKPRLRALRHLNEVLLDELVLVLGFSLLNIDSGDYGIINRNDLF